MNSEMWYLWLSLTIVSIRSGVKKRLKTLSGESRMVTVGPTAEVKDLMVSSCSDVDHCCGSLLLFSSEVCTLCEHVPLGRTIPGGSLLGVASLAWIGISVPVAGRLLTHVSASSQSRELSKKHFLLVLDLHHHLQDTNLSHAFNSSSLPSIIGSSGSSKSHISSSFESTTMPATSARVK